MEQPSQILQYFDKLPTFNFNNAKIMQIFFDLALFCKIRLKWKIYVSYAKFCIEVFPDDLSSELKLRNYEDATKIQVHLKST